VYITIRKLTYKYILHIQIYEMYIITKQLKGWIQNSIMPNMEIGVRHYNTSTWNTHHECTTRTSVPQIENTNYHVLVWIPLSRGVLDTTFCYIVCQRIATGRWFSPGTPVSSTNKTDRHDIAKILWKWR
jgi:hypothetical protein